MKRTSARLNKAQAAALQLLRIRLDPDHEHFAGSSEVEKALRGDLKLYLNTWVLPLVVFLQRGEGYFGEAKFIQREHDTRVSAAKAHAQWVQFEAAKKAAQ